jgi:hypothetical protein
MNLCKRGRDFGRFEINNRDLGRQQVDRILVAEEDIPHEIQERHSQQSFLLMCGLGLLKKITS